MKQKSIRLLIHIGACLVFLSFPFVVVSLIVPAAIGDVPRITTPFIFIFSLNFFLILFFYLNGYYLLPNVYFSKKKSLYYIMVLGVFCLYIFIQIWLQSTYNERHSVPRMPGPGIFMSVPLFLLSWLLSSLLNLSAQYRKAQDLNKEMEVEKKNAELSYLKAQINPHFLFNTLNSIYSLAITQSEHTGEAILKLSDIMRYITQDATKNEVPLEKEIEYISNYIQLQRLRHTNNLTLNYRVEANHIPYSIAPLLLINFIENAFKYGVSNQIPSQIDIDIKMDKNILLLNVKNKIVRTEITSESGTGIWNSQKRLQLQYPNRHKLNMDNHGGYHSISLQIQLS